jgi:hypothetical protein
VRPERLKLSGHRRLESVANGRTPRASFRIFYSAAKLTGVIFARRSRSEVGSERLVPGALVFVWRHQRLLYYRLSLSHAKVL